MIVLKKDTGTFSGKFSQYSQSPQTFGNTGCFSNAETFFFKILSSSTPMNPSLQDHFIISLPWFHIGQTGTTVNQNFALRNFHFISNQNGFFLLKLKSVKFKSNKPLTQERLNNETMISKNPRTLVVTGASSGIGQCIVEEQLRLGRRIIGIGRTFSKK
ncbi:MAG: hypothetical protein CM1200mP24_07320 [Gammaproteobacteria bacterium]|nr:MAG: hypothetical protein CM1200mP24_07320 [Gammaproteobacteria bacterium]